jgi:fumarate hydratase class II
MLQSVELIAAASRSFADNAIAGLEPDNAVIAAHLERSLMLVTALVPKVGYDTAAKIAQAAHAGGTTLREAAVASGLVTAAEFDALIDPAKMTGPG